MAVEENVKYNVTMNDLISGKIKAANQAATGLSKTMSGLGGILGVLGVGGGVAGIAAIASGIVNTTAEFEKYNAVLTNTLGSSEKASAAMSDITEFAAKTPFQVNELTDSYVRLANQGFQPTMEEMRKLGDLASSTGKGFDMLSEAIIDAQTGEFERLKEFGIKASKNGDKVTFSFKGIKTTVDNTSESIQKYMLGLGDLQGVSGAMAAISGTTGGQISNLEDNMTSLWLKIGTSLKPAISGLITGLYDMVSAVKDGITWLQQSEKGIKSIGVAIGVASGAYLIYNGWQKAIVAWETLKYMWMMRSELATAALTSAQWLLNIAMDANPVGAIIAGIALLAGWYYYANSETKEFREGLLMLKDDALIAYEAIAYGINKLKGDEEAATANMVEMNRLLQERKELIEGTYNASKGMEVTTDGSDGKPKPFSMLLPEKEKNGITKGVPMPAGETANKAPKAPSAQANKAITINVTIGKLIETFKIQTNNMSESTSKIKEMVASTLTDALNDSQIVAGI